MTAGDHPTLAQVVTYCRNAIAPANLTPGQALVLLCIATHYNRIHGHAKPSQRVLATELRMNEGAVRKIVAHLIDVGVFQAARPANTRHAAMRYVFPIKSAVRAVDDSAPEQLFGR